MSEENAQFEGDEGDGRVDPSNLSAGDVIRRCAELGKRLELLANLVLLTTLGNVGVTIIFFLYTIFKMSDLNSSSWAREQYYTFLTLAIATTILLLVLSILSLTQFQRTSRTARIFSAEISDSLSWYRRSSKSRNIADLKIAIRELAGRSDLPLSTGSGGYLVYFSLNIITVISFVAFIATTVTNLPR